MGKGGGRGQQWLLCENDKEAKGADLDMVQGILVNDFDSAADERLCGSIVVRHNMLPGFCIAATALPDLAPLALQLLQLLPVVSVACIILIWKALKLQLSVYFTIN